MKIRIFGCAEEGYFISRLKKDIEGWYVEVPVAFFIKYKAIMKDYDFLQQELEKLLDKEMPHPKNPYYKK